MVKFLIINLKSKQYFTKTFESPYLANKFKNKAKYSKDIKIIGEEYNCYEI